MAPNLNAGERAENAIFGGGGGFLNTEPELIPSITLMVHPKSRRCSQPRKQCHRRRVTVGRTRIRSFMIISTLGLPSSYLSSPCLLVFSARPFPSSMQFYAIKQRTRIRSFFSGPVYLSVARSEARKRQEGRKNGRSVVGITGFVMNPSDILAVLL